MANFYLLLEDRLLKISGDITVDTITRALGYIPSNFSGDFNDLTNNPFVVDDSGEFNIVDEEGNIAAKINSLGLYVADVTAGEHVLSNKADLVILDNYSTKEELNNFSSEVESNYSTKKELTFENIANNPLADDESDNFTIIDSENNIGLLLNEDGLHVKEVFVGDHVLSNKAENSDVEEISDKVNTLIGEDSDKSVRTIANEELLTQLLEGNDNFQTLQELAAWIEEHPEDASAMNEAIQTNASNITKLDTDYKEADQATLVEAKEYTDNINFNNLKDSPFIDDGSGELNIQDESGNIGFKLTSEGVVAKEFMTELHVLSNKANQNDVDSAMTSVNNKINTLSENTTNLFTLTTEYINLLVLETKEYSNQNLNTAKEYTDSNIATVTEHYTGADVTNLQNAKQYTDTAVSNIDFVDINNNPVVSDEKGELNIVDELGNIGLKIDSNGIYVKDVVAGNHILSNKAEQSEVTNISNKVNSLDNKFTTNIGDLSTEITNSNIELTNNISEIGDRITTIEDDYLKSSDKEELQESDITNLNTAKVYADSKVANLQFDLILGNPISTHQNEGEFNIADELGNVGLKINEDGIYVKDVIAGEHVLSNKMDNIEFKTINGESILGNGNIDISSGNCAYSEVSHGTSDTTFTLTPNTFHVWDEVSSLTLTLGNETAGVTNEFLFQFNSGSTATTLTLPDTLKWANDSAPTIEANKIYQISILKGLASVLVFENTPNLIDNIAIYFEGDMMSGATLTFQYPVVSDLTIGLSNAESSSTTISSGETSITIDWFEPMAPSVLYIEPASDSVYNYILA